MGGEERQRLPLIRREHHRPTLGTLDPLDSPPAPRRPLFIVNREAGGGRAARAERLVVAELRARGGEGWIVHTTGPGRAAELATQGARDGYSPIVGVGGDGTLSEIADALVRLEDAPPMAVVPAGTGNDYARCAGLPLDQQEALRLVWEGQERRMDLGFRGDRAVLNVAGVGFDALVGRTATAMPRLMRKAGIAYVVAVLLTLARNPKQDLTVRIDDRTIEVPRAMMVVVANGRYYGGGMMICPEASRDDGLLDVCVVGDVTRWAILRLLPKIFTGGHTRHPAVSLYQARRVEIEGPADCGSQVDGELVGGLPACFTVSPGALRVILPHV